MFELRQKDRREIANNRIPRVAGIGRGINLTARGSEINAALIERIDCHGVAQHVHVAIALRQVLS